MAKGGKIGYKRKTKKIRLEKQGSDESDEDYRLDEDEEIDLSEDDYCSLAEDESEESLGDFEAEEADEEDWITIGKKVKKCLRPKGRKCLQIRKRNGVVKPRRKQVASSEGEDSDDYNFSGATQNKTNKVSNQEDKNEEIDLSEDDYCSRDEGESEESLGDFEAEKEDEEEWISMEKKVTKCLRPRGRKCLQTIKRNGVVKTRRKKVAYSEGEDSDEYNFSGATQKKTNKLSKQEDKHDEIDLSEDDDCSLAEDESEESLGDIEVDEEDDEEWISIEKKVKKTIRPRGRKCLQTRKRNRVVNPRRKKVVYSEGEDSDEYKASKQDDKNYYIEAAYRPEQDEFADEKPRNKYQVARAEKYGDSSNENPRKKVLYQEEDEDDDYDDSDDADDEEFTPGEVLKQTRRMPVQKRVLRRKTRSYLLKESRDGNPTSLKNKTITRRRRKSNVNSDSDFMSSGSSDYEYTISEEEREQVREATTFCTGLTTNSLRSSSPSVMVKEEEMPPSKRKRPGRKGKQKVVDLKIEVGKQVCGICLSEEGKRTVRGVLNCCSHYFCFVCILEWSKVESRCPLCKQRFATISRTARADDGRDLRDAVFPVPERDQVYQPSEEELRGYLDPYENVLCTECQQGGDDALMLLCDLCDSPAHTYCVGLGREVPDGNWYCEGCRPTAIASSNVQSMNPIPDDGGTNNFYGGSSPIASARETFDLNELFVPDTPLSGHSQSPRHSIGHFGATSPVSGAGAFTLLERRRIQRQIHQLLNNRSRQSGRSDGGTHSSGISLFGSVIGRDEAIADAVMPARTVPQNFYFQGTTPANHSSEYVGLNLVGGLGHQQLLHPCNGTSTTGVDASTSQCQSREATVPSRTLQGSLHSRF